MKLFTATFLNFKKLKNCNIRFNDFNILIGPNNAGKTTLLEGLYFALTMMNPTNKFDWLSKISETEDIEIQVFLKLEERYLTC